MSGATAAGQPQLLQGWGIAARYCRVRQWIRGSSLHWQKLIEHSNGLEK